MTILYSCRHDGDQYRITKFDHDLNVESSYLCDTSACECPAGVRFTCRHREMLPKFINRGAVGTGWMFDYDRGGWVDMRQDDELYGVSPAISAGALEMLNEETERMKQEMFERESALIEPAHNPTATEIDNTPWPKFPDPPLVEALVDDLYNSVVELTKPAPTKIYRRL